MKRWKIAAAIAAIVVSTPAFSAAAEAAIKDGGIKPVSMVQPEYPYEAVKAGATKGTVTARMTLDAAGKVTNVEIVDAVPRRLFDKAVTRALADWRYAEGSAGRTVEIEIAFRKE